MWNKTQAEALKKLFENFDAHSIQWMVFRNFEGLPDKNPSKDVDLLVKREQIPQARKILEQTMRSQGYTRETFDRFQCIWCYSFFKEGAQADSIKIDLFYGQVWRGAPTVEFSRIYETADLYHGFRVPDVVMNAFLLWIKPVMTGGKVKEKYLPDIAAQMHRPEFAGLVQETFGEKFCKKVLLFLTEQRLRETGALQKEMCRLSWQRALRKHPFRVIWDTCAHFTLEILRRSRRPRATVICLLGPDGVGKTTVIDLLCQEAQDTFIRDEEKIQIWHFRPGILPNLKELVAGKERGGQEEFTAPHRAQPAGAFSSALRLLYYWLDYNLGRFKTQKACTQGALVIYDRYVYDFVIDPRRSRIALPDGLRRAMARSVPQPDKVFILSASAQTIFARKQELELQEIQRQLQEYQKLAAWGRRFVVLDAEQAPEELARQIRQEWVGLLRLVPALED